MHYWAEGIPIKIVYYKKKKLEGIDKRDQMLCSTEENTCPGWLLIKGGGGIYNSQLALVNTLVIYKVKAFGVLFSLEAGEKIDYLFIK